MYTKQRINHVFPQHLNKFYVLPCWRSMHDLAKFLFLFLILKSEINGLNVVKLFEKIPIIHYTFENKIVAKQALSRSA